MAEGTIGMHVDEATLSDLMEVAAAENRSASQLVAIALNSTLGLPPASRRALFALDGIANEQERSFAIKAIGRSVLKAYDATLDARHQDYRPAARND